MAQRSHEGGPFIGGPIQGWRGVELESRSLFREGALLKGAICRSLLDGGFLIVESDMRVALDVERN